MDEQVKDDNLQESPEYANEPVEALRKRIESQQGQDAPQAEIQVQEESAPESAEEAGKTDKEKEPPPLIAGKFKTQEDLIKAYEEIEKMAHKHSQRASQYKNIMEPYVEFDEDGNFIGFKPQTTKPQTQQQTTPQQSDILQQLEQRYQLYEQQYGPVRANIMLQTEIANAIARNNLEALTAPVEELKASQSIEEQKKQLKESDVDFVKFEAEVDKHLKRMDSKSKQHPRAVQSIYNMVLGENYKRLLQEREQEASLKAAEIENQKQKAQVEHQTKPPEEPSIDIESLSSSDLASQMGLKRAER